MKRIATLALLLLAVLQPQKSKACTSIIISGKYTADGRPIMWKHRDTSSENNKLIYFTGKRFDYIGLVSTETENKSVWMGMNSAGFCIMNTASYNINNGESYDEGVGEGEVMALALASCSTLEDFEKLLKGIARPTGLASNFGVIDASGGAAFFEVGDEALIKIDVNNQDLAPLGYIVRTNYSANGNPDLGQGYARYITASDVFYKAAMRNDLTVEGILSVAERNLVNGFTGDNLLDLATGEDEVRMVHFKDNIARKSTTSSVIFKGVKKGDDPMATQMWTIGGWPLATPAIPVWMNKEKLLPAILTAPEGKNAALCDMALLAKRAAMPITRGHGQDYININKVYNTDGSGYIQWIVPLENEILKLTESHSARWTDRDIPSSKELKLLYDEIEELIRVTYSKHGMYF
ncbi:MAG: carcinine hydrolase/isopenicillin-N N-acyltransferase family protein [Marinilabiliaceae bacterium]|jgi:hypothetical protein|nr:carcinine hydrolase/isopenicillin-N N-acyltransferase family protein [Marinilabiliaceae bacterium]